MISIATQSILQGLIYFKNEEPIIEYSLFYFSITFEQIMAENENPESRVQEPDFIDFGPPS